MTAKKSKEVPRPVLTTEEQREMIVNEMLLLRLFPLHEQAEEFRRNVEYARRRLPALYLQAEVLVKDKMAAEDRLLEHPEECTRCGGTGIFTWQGSFRYCGCAAGDRAAKKGEMPETAPRLAVVPKQSAREQLQQIRSLFDPPEE